MLTATCVAPPPPEPFRQVKAALSHWDGTGNFVFTSSLSVCSVDDGGSVTDDNCPTLPMGAGPSTDRLLAAEQAVLQVSARDSAAADATAKLSAAAGGGAPPFAVTLHSYKHVLTAM